MSAMSTLPPYLSEADLDALLARAWTEDIGRGDITTAATVPAQTQGQATITAKASGVVAGLYVAAHVFRHAGAPTSIRWHVSDGTRVEPGTTVGTLRGNAAALLTAERLALNLMQRMSGIATATARMVEAARPHAPDILDTRKTAPGLRALDKWAVHLGGGTNHRIGLYDLFLIKDNHIAAAGGIAEALDAAQRYRDTHNTDLGIELEVRTLDELDAALAHGGPDILLLDNMTHVMSDGTVDVSMLQTAVDRVDGQCRTEASGNVTLRTVTPIAATGVDAISSGALTHSVTALDLSMGLELL
ncbi:nicotinate-nucleotide diphosphorylase (carboxylating) [Longimonas halophila]|uniref:nicotinate-nucleotide diphosphorylase (carboxylating) n=2 Tax=Longimonas halophila TaxID=1469170 RepID=A0A2H3NJX8_9BACT|nr:nicotinate-nucleotide diphosphorylase (carboxylating) [Longimonas halophila]